MREVRSIVLTGAGPGFSTGGDLRMMREAVERLHAAGDEEGATMPWQWIRYQFGAMVRLIGRVTNTDGSPREMVIALRKFSSSMGPSTNPSNSGAGSHRSLMNT